ncbi:methyl-accepting chemotaxis protein [Agrobacterium vitis]|nr:methyl-accepting chemotaxis protein [Agrobacterium vitis]MBE1439817.1 methyl-accepting chemotaxis protein [Agrobacterium vitis]
MLGKISIKAKLLLVIIVLGLLSVAGISHIASSFSTANNTYLRFIENEANSGILAARASAGMWTAVNALGRVAINKAGTPEFDEAKAAFTRNVDGALDRLNTVAKSVPQTAPNVEQLRGYSEQYRDHFNKIVTLKQDGKDAEAIELFKSLDKLAQEFSSKSGATNAFLTTLLNEGGKKIGAETSTTITTTITILVLCFIIVLGLGFYIATVGISKPMETLRKRMASLANGELDAAIEGGDRSDEIGAMAQTVVVFRDNALERRRLQAEAEVTRQQSDAERSEREGQKARAAADMQQVVSLLAGGLRQLAAGDLTHQITTPFSSDLDGLRHDFNEAIGKLNEALSRVGDNAQTIMANSNEARSSSDDLSKRTEQQAAAVEETAAALEQITTTVRDGAKRAEEARHLMTSTGEDARNSGQVVRSAVEAMHAIEASSSEISNIIGVIDEIAFQTNLLALNAGVEAARAGEAGKGFAVVAQEVRELAQRSANAAREIKSLINTSSTQVANGVTLVVSTGEALDAIVHRVQDVTKHVQGIADAYREQSLGLQEINTAINSLDQGTQQNAAMAEEATANAHNLATSAESLLQLLARFQLAQTVQQRRYAA